MSAQHHPRAGTPQATGRARSTTVARSRLCGSVPNAEPQSPPSRDAQNASATSGGAYRTSSEPCSTVAIRSTSRMGPALDAVQVGEFGQQVLDGAVQPVVRTARLPHLPQIGVQRARLPLQRAQHVQRLHIARPLPDGVEGDSRNSLGMPDSST